MTLERLTADAFRPFGAVITHDGIDRRSMVAIDGDAGARPLLWLAKVRDVVQFPHIFKALERHPHSSQTFIPRGDFPHVVVVALGTGTRPDIETVRCFLATGDQGVTYARHCWHLGLTPLNAGAEYVVSMVETDAPDQTVLGELSDECAVSFPTIRAQNGMPEH